MTDTDTQDCDIDPAPSVDCPGCGLPMPARHVVCALCITDATSRGRESKALRQRLPEWTQARNARYVRIILWS